MKIKKMTIGLLFLLLSGCGTANNPSSLMGDGVDFFVSGEEEDKGVPVVYPAELSSSSQGSSSGFFGSGWENGSKEYLRYRVTGPALRE